jgi:hypothetical protein
MILGNQKETSEFDDFDVINGLDELVFVEYDDGVFRWVNNQEFDRLNRQDKATLDFLSKVHKTTLICYFSSLYVPLTILSVNASGSLKARSSANPFNNQTCVQKIDEDNDNNCHDFAVGRGIDYRPENLRTKKSKNKKVGIGRTLSGKTFYNETLSPSPISPIFIPIFIPIEKSGSVQSKQPLLVVNSSSKEIVLKKEQSKFSSIELSTNKNRNVINLKNSNKIISTSSPKQNDFLKKEVLKNIQERNEYINVYREVLKEKNVQIIVRELESFQKKILSLRGGITVPGLGGLPFAKQILNWSVQKATTILTNESEKQIKKDKEESKTSRKNLLKLFDVRNPLVLVGLTVIGFTILLKGKDGHKKIEELTDNIQEAIGLKKKKTIRNIVTDTTYSFLSFYAKRPLLFLLTLFFIWQRKLVYTLITNKTERGTFTELAFNTIQTQMEELVKSKDGFLKTTEKWMDTFFKRMETFTEESRTTSRSTITELKEKVAELEKVKEEKDKEILHDKLVIQKAQIYFNQCENAHQKTYDDIIKLDQQCKATGSRHEKLQKLLTSSPEALALPTPQQLEITMIQNELKQAREDQTIEPRVSFIEEFNKEVTTTKVEGGVGSSKKKK